MRKLLLTLSLSLSLSPAWAQEITGDPISPPTSAWTDFSTSYFYPVSPWQVSISAGLTATANTIYCAPSSWSTKMTLAALSFNVATVFSGGNVQLALYTSSSGRPGALVANTGSGLTTATGFISPTFAAGSGTSVQVGPFGAQAGTNLWVCQNRDNATAVLTPLSITGITTPQIGSATTANITASTGNEVAGVFCAGANCTGGSSTFGTWPASLAGSTWSDITSRLFGMVYYTPSSIP